MKNTDMKNFRARPKINKDRAASFVLAILLVIALSVRFEPASAEPQLSVVTYDCAPTIELDMPIKQGMQL
ncbi:hypothetical protein SAMN05216428_102318 [Nitrosospira sp. Nsp11]|uniref:hypothetical protein n=1 Tax=Nitrosospira sp. Nsp11 TaxID=1855338 RepID=UPI00090F384E|nr:hypothetical protein [Nitrosospira sp. Nsp11]SHL41146.1 hypothetical protein SAMN05216428_102318 [Nitrosospira sp. Nsp11]